MSQPAVEKTNAVLDDAAARRRRLQELREKRKRALEGRGGISVSAANEEQRQEIARRLSPLIARVEAFVQRSSAWRATWDADYAHHPGARLRVFEDALDDYTKALNETADVIATLNDMGEINVKIRTLKETFDVAFGHIEEAHALYTDGKLEGALEQMKQLDTQASELVVDLTGVLAMQQKLDPDDVTKQTAQPQIDRVRVQKEEMKRGAFDKYPENIDNQDIFRDAENEVKRRYERAQKLREDLDRKIQEWRVGFQDQRFRAQRETLQHTATDVHTLYTQYMEAVAELDAEVRKQYGDANGADNTREVDAQIISTDEWLQGNDTAKFLGTEGVLASVEAAERKDIDAVVGTISAEQQYAFRQLDEITPFLGGEFVQDNLALARRGHESIERELGDLQTQVEAFNAELQALYANGEVGRDFVTTNRYDYVAPNAEAFRRQQAKYTPWTRVFTPQPGIAAIVKWGQILKRHDLLERQATANEMRIAHFTTALFRGRKRWRLIWDRDALTDAPKVKLFEKDENDPSIGRLKTNKELGIEDNGPFDKFLDREKKRIVGPLQDGVIVVPDEIQLEYLVLFYEQQENGTGADWERWYSGLETSLHSDFAANVDDVYVVIDKLEQREQDDIRRLKRCLDTERNLRQRLLRNIVERYLAAHAEYRDTPGGLEQLDSDEVTQPIRRLLANMFNASALFTALEYDWNDKRTAASILKEPNSFGFVDGYCDDADKIFEDMYGLKPTLPDQEWHGGLYSDVGTLLDDKFRVLDETVAYQKALQGRVVELNTKLAGLVGNARDKLSQLQANKATADTLEAEMVKPYEASTSTRNDIGQNTVPQAEELAATGNDAREIDAFVQNTFHNARERIDSLLQHENRDLQEHANEIAAQNMNSKAFVEEIKNSKIAFDAEYATLSSDNRNDAFPDVVIAIEEVYGQYKPEMDQLVTQSVAIDELLGALAERTKNQADESQMGLQRMDEQLKTIGEQLNARATSLRTSDSVIASAKARVDAVVVPLLDNDIDPQIAATKEQEKQYMVLLATFNVQKDALADVTDRQRDAAAARNIALYEPLLEDIPPIERELGSVQAQTTTFAETLPRDLRYEPITTEYRRVVEVLNEQITIVSQDSVASASPAGRAAIDEMITRRSDLESRYVAFDNAYTSLVSNGDILASAIRNEIDSAAELRERMREEYSTFRDNMQRDEARDLVARLERIQRDQNSLLSEAEREFAALTESMATVKTLATNAENEKRDGDIASDLGRAMDRLRDASTRLTDLVAESNEHVEQSLTGTLGDRVEQPTRDRVSTLRDGIRDDHVSIERLGRDASEQSKDAASLEKTALQRAEEYRDRKAKEELARANAEARRIELRDNAEREARNAGDLVENARVAHRDLKTLVDQVRGRVTQARNAGNSADELDEQIRIVDEYIREEYETNDKVKAYAESIDTIANQMRVVLSNIAEWKATLDDPVEAGNATENAETRINGYLGHVQELASDKDNELKELQALYIELRNDILRTLRDKRQALDDQEREKTRERNAEFVTWYEDAIKVMRSKLSQARTAIESAEALHAKWQQVVDAFERENDTTGVNVQAIELDTEQHATFLQKANTLIDEIGDTLADVEERVMAQLDPNEPLDSVDDLRVQRKMTQGIETEANNIPGAGNGFVQLDQIMRALRDRIVEIAGGVDRALNEVKKREKEEADTIIRVSAEMFRTGVTNRSRAIGVAFTSKQFLPRVHIGYLFDLLKRYSRGMVDGVSDDLRGITTRELGLLGELESAIDDSSYKSIDRVLTRLRDSSTGNSDIIVVGRTPDETQDLPFRQDRATNDLDAALGLWDREIDRSIVLAPVQQDELRDMNGRVRTAMQSLLEGTYQRLPHDVLIQPAVRDEFERTFMSLYQYIGAVDTLLYSYFSASNIEFVQNVVDLAREYADIVVVTSNGLRNVGRFSSISAAIASWKTLQAVREIWVSGGGAFDAEWNAVDPVTDDNVQETQSTAVAVLGGIADFLAPTHKTPKLQFKPEGVRADLVAREDEYAKVCETLYADVRHHIALAWREHENARNISDSDIEGSDAGSDV